MILVIDNYDSFTYNLVQVLRKQGRNVEVIKNDEWTPTQIAAIEDKISAFLISPGPGHPQQAVLSRYVVEQYHQTHPILGVCLGHQVIAELFGAKVVPASRLMHGKISQVFHQQSGSFATLENPFQAVRYHSLIVAEDSLPPCLDELAWSYTPQQKKEIMAIQHNQWKVEGWQFHPESVLTKQGEELIQNFFSFLV